MEEFSGRGELRRMQREQERERRRIRDRQRRQSMTQEQRERHLARRRRNYQLRRQRAANAHLPYSFPQFQPPESSAGEASTSDELQGLPSPTFAEYGIFPHVIGFPHHHLNLGQQMLNMGTKVVQGSSVPLETLLCKPANSPKRMRLNHVRGLARNLTHSIVNPPCIRLVASELIPKEHQDVSVGSTVKSLRLNCVKRLARSKNSFYEETAYENDLKFPAGGFSYLLARTS
ncbi:uncharacterized protein LOC124839424 [Vigna umbellata]|uniref:uncharacterized protein LOC124839424 n=1 Tax=Vigna umbellata TaxID=87088 RepID=UPI001F5E3FA8|nr:uncharacterized protein LOC124839424 [Vigna umbellata]